MKNGVTTKMCITLSRNIPPHRCRLRVADQVSLDSGVSVTPTVGSRLDLLPHREPVDERTRGPRRTRETVYRKCFDQGYEDEQAEKNYAKATTGANSDSAVQGP